MNSFAASFASYLPIVPSLVKVREVQEIANRIQPWANVVGI